MSKLEYYYPTLLGISCPRRLHKMSNWDPIDWVHKLTAEGKKAHGQIESLIKENMNVKMFIETLGGSIKDCKIELKDKINLNGYEFRFKPDLYFKSKDRYVIIDFKNRYRTDIYDSDKFQLEAYAFSIMQNDITVNRALLYLYAIQSDNARQVEVIHQDDLDDIKDNIMKGILQAEATLEHPDYHTETGKDCEWCKWLLECPAYTYQAKNESVEELSKELIGLEQRRKALQYAIKSHMKGNDLTEIETDIGKVLYEATTKTGYDFLPIFYQLMEMFQNDIKQLEKYINFSIKDLKRLTKDNEELANYIFDEAGYPRFTTKVKED